ncbi:O-antigen ligase family protein [Myroides odoratus]|uniref:O-antigen ligase family protein n=1 Tax=Myroides odoratus TaxID=256 RepID=UPI0039AF4F61
MKNKINSIGLAIFLCANPISWIFPVSNIIVFICLFSLVLLLLNNNITIFINKKLFVFVLIMVLFLFSYAYSLPDRETFLLYFSSFLVFGLTGILYSSCEIDYKFFYYAVSLIAIISIPGIYLVEFKVFDSLVTASGFYMGVSYGVLRLILALILTVSFLHKRIFKIIAITVILYYLTFYFKYGTRGALLALLLFLALIFLEKRKLLKTRAIIISVILLFLVSFVFIDLLLLIKEILDNFGYNIKAIDKILMFNESQQDLSNGRGTLLGYAFLDILDSLFIGNGIAVFDEKYGIYPHNFIIQVLYEGGLLYLIPMLIIIFRFFKIIVSNQYTKEYKIFLIYLFSAGIIELLFSNVYWRSVFFWLFMGVLLNNKRK